MKLQLRILSGLQVGDQGRIDPPGGLIGRGEGCALHLRDESISRAHMELRYEQDGWWAFQRSTRSPSLVDGNPVGSSPMALRERGVLQVGRVQIEYAHEQAPVLADLPESPPTMINVRRQLPAIQHAVLPQMTRLRAVEPPPSDTPPTLILRRQPAAPPDEAPPTLISRPAPAVPRPPVPPSPAPQTTEPPLAGTLRQVEKERDQLRSERDQLAEELVQRSREVASLREAQSTSPAAAAPAPSALAAQALKLLQPFSDSLEQASSALQEGDASRARMLLREASFGLADLRDLFESAG